MLFDVVDYDKDVVIGGYHFRNITRNTLAEIREFLGKQEYRSSSICYFGYVANYLAIDDYGSFRGYRYLYRMIDGLLCIFTENLKTHAMVLFHTPIGNASWETKRSVFRKCIKLMYVINDGKFPCRIENCHSDYLAMLNRKKLSYVDHYSDEFVFSTTTLTELGGKSFKSVRHAINKFKSEHKYEFRAYVDEDFQSAMRVYDAWCEDYKAKAEQAKKDSKKPLPPIWDSDLFPKQLKYHREMGIVPYVLFVDGNMVGVSGIAELCGDCSVILFEKCINKFDGITEFMWIEMLRAYPNFKPLECDGDGGKSTSGLYAYKMKFNPVILSPCNIVTINKKGDKITEAYFKRKDEFNET